MKPKGKVLGKLTLLKLSADQLSELPKLSVGRGGYQSTFARIEESVKLIDGKPVAHVYTRELEKLREWAGRDDAGTWQDWARGVLMENGLLTD